MLSIGRDQFCSWGGREIINGSGLEIKILGGPHLVKQFVHIVAESHSNYRVNHGFRPNIVGKCNDTIILGSLLTIFEVINIFWGRLLTFVKCKLLGYKKKLKDFDTSNVWYSLCIMTLEAKWLKNLQSMIDSNTSKKVRTSVTKCRVEVKIRSKNCHVSLEWTQW